MTMAECSPLVAHAPSSAPGPDGVRYSHWAQAGLAAILRRGHERMPASGRVQRGQPCFHAHVARRQLHGCCLVRPLTLSNGDQNIVARGVNSALTVMAHDMVHPLQRGWVHDASGALREHIIFQQRISQVLRGGLAGLRRQRRFKRVQHLPTTEISGVTRRLGGSTTPASL